MAPQFSPFLILFVDFTPIKADLKLASKSASRRHLLSQNKTVPNDKIQKSNGGKKLPKS
jgi:hypothetical protein